MGVTGDGHARGDRYVVLIPAEALSSPGLMIFTYMASAAFRDGLDVSVDLVPAGGIDAALLEPRIAAGMNPVVFHQLRPEEQRVFQGLGVNVLLPLEDSQTAAYRAAAAINAALGRVAAMRLITYGRAKLAFVAPQLSAYRALVQLRYAGVWQACLAAGVAAPVMISVPGDLAEMARKVVIQGQDNSGFDGYVCYDDIAAMRTIAALRMIGKMVPYDGSVVGTGDSAASALVNPTITSVAIDYAAVGNALGPALVTTLKGGEYSPPSPDVLDALLHVASRDSA